ncbi:copper-binding protein [Lysobacter helvus]|uniref:Copper-binding protein n=2 Tax=Lysobacteraceae TaxID=32033 RepID=A0ABN6FWS1_9GAMM|nr:MULTISPECIES: copper-binding protein [Lysobacter]BCT93879.1 copper-binding protein [Lysobacter caseinilyticus]BCT97035.1 copper-binding protein [Lysobacter helvus]
MKHLTLLFVPMLLAACSQDRPPQETGPQPVAAATSARAMADVAPATVATASGVVEAMDPAGGTITIAHGPVAQLKWPPMTMKFRTGAIDVTAIRLGDHVDFKFKSQGMDATLTEIARRQPEN